MKQTNILMNVTEVNEYVENYIVPAKAVSDSSKIISIDGITYVVEIYKTKICQNYYEYSAITFLPNVCHVDVDELLKYAIYHSNMPTMEIVGMSEMYGEQGRDTLVPFIAYILAKFSTFPPHIIVDLNDILPDGNYNRKYVYEYIMEKIKEGQIPFMRYYAPTKAVFKI